MKCNTHIPVKLFTIVFCLLSFGAFKTQAQYYEWAFNESFVTDGNFGSFVGADFHGNGIFSGYRYDCQSCVNTYVKVFDPSGQVIWDETFPGTLQNVTPPIVLSVASDYNNNRYILFENNGSQLNFGTFSTNYARFIVKYDASGNPVRLTNLNDPYFKLVADSSGNMFVASGTKSRRYTKAGTIAWTKTNYPATDIHVDRKRNCYISNDTSFVKLSPAGNLGFQKSVGGNVSVDLDGRVFVQNTTGLRKYSISGQFQWLRPTILDPYQINANGNIYVFTSDSITKYNAKGTKIQWTTEKLSDGIVSLNGDIYIGGSYSTLNDDIQPCPFRILKTPISQQIEENQVWVGKVSGAAPIPFQAAVYTNQIGNPDQICTSIPIGNYASPSLFSFCTNSASSFDPGNIFSVQISDSLGSFSNAIDLGPPATAVVPDSISFATGYRIRVVASTPGVTAHANLPNMNDFGITVIPNPGTLSASGTVSICEDKTYVLSVSTSSQTNAIGWFNDGVPLNVPALTNPVILDSAGNYYAVLSNNICTRVSDTLNLIVDPRPDPVISPTGSVNICSGDSILLAVTDIDMNVIRWRRNGVSVTGAVDSIFYASLPGIYTARIINSFGCARASAPVDVNVNCRQGEGLLSNAINMYPNPVSNVVYIDGLYDFIGAASVNVFDYSGKLVYENTSFVDERAALELNLSYLAPGVYMIRLRNGANSIGKMIVKE